MFSAEITQNGVRLVQHTLRKPVEIKGIGLHTGKPVLMRVLPAEKDQGRKFIRTDLIGKPEVKVSWENRLEIPLCTALKIGNDRLLTVEHFLAACQALELDNLTIEIDGGELPALDGSALGFYQALLEGDRIEQGKLETLKLKETIVINDGQAFIIAMPADTLRLSYLFTSNYHNVPDMFYDFVPSKDDFAKELAPARTIAFREQLNEIRAKGLALGGDESMVVLIDKTGFANERRFANEVARHKLLDLLGDLSLIGEYRLEAHIVAVATGHRHNAELAKKISLRMFPDRLK